MILVIPRAPCARVQRGLNYIRCSAVNSASISLGQRNVEKNVQINHDLVS